VGHDERNKTIEENDTLNAKPFSGIATIYRAAGWHEGSDCEKGF
jgi:hypothetical protein